MSKFKRGKTYSDENGNKLRITKIYGDSVYYESDTKKGGLIDKIGRYFLNKSIYANELKED